MEKIASFQIDHLRLLPGIYVSRVDRAGGAAVTTFDLRFTAPNREPVMGTAEIPRHRAPGRDLSAQRARVERPRALLRAHGLPHGLLFADGGGTSAA